MMGFGKHSLSHVLSTCLCLLGEVISNLCHFVAGYSTTKFSEWLAISTLIPTSFGICQSTRRVSPTPLSSPSPSRRRPMPCCCRTPWVTLLLLIPSSLSRPLLTLSPPSSSRTTTYLLSIAKLCLTTCYSGSRRDATTWMASPRRYASFMTILLVQITLDLLQLPDAFSLCTTAIVSSACTSWSYCYSAMALHNFDKLMRLIQSSEAAAPPLDWQWQCVN